VIGGPLASGPIAVIRATLTLVAHMGCAVLTMAAPSDAVPIIAWQVEEGQNHLVSLSGLNTEAISLLRNAKPADLARVFPVQVELEDPIQQLNAPAIGGSYAVVPGGLNFRPGFPFERGVRYRASLRPDVLPGLAQHARSQTQLFHRERLALAASTVVREIYPRQGNFPTICSSFTFISRPR